MRQAVVDAVSFLVVLLGLAGCGEPRTQVAVTIDGDPAVMKELRRIEARVYPTDMPVAAIVAKHLFTLPAGSGPDQRPREPLSFGIERGAADHFELVVEGYASEDAQAAPVIERKVFARFKPHETRALSVYFAGECLHLSNPCRALQTTCLPSARACAAVEEAATTAHPDESPTARTGGSEEAGVCAVAQDCSQPDYLCTPTTGDGYTCLGQFADWPMPDSSSIAKTAPRYTTIPGLVEDAVTGLIWQRDLPETYPGCTGSQPVVPVTGSTCTWDEAKIYCSQFSVGGRRFRVPSKVELESILDLDVPTPPFDNNVFPGRNSVTVWTSSPVVETIGKDAVFAWAVSWPGATVSQATEMSAAVRCVSGTPSVSSTPAQRYAAEGTDVIRDVHTTLSWLRRVSPPLESSEAAASYCQNVAGGFRIPTHKELLTLVDPTRRAPAIDPIFTNTPSAAFWSAPLRAPSPTGQGPLVVNFFQGASHPVGASRVALAGSDNGSPRVRCVR